MSNATFIALRWETPFTPCTGITAVVKQERRHFAGRAVYVAPWCPEMAEARKAQDAGKVSVLRDEHLVLAGSPAGRIEILETTDTNLAPILFLSLPDDPDAFRGRRSPYDTPHLERDCLLFALAFERLMQGVGATAFIWAADWQCVPAMARFFPRRVTCLHLHNLYDTYLGKVADDIGYDQAEQFRDRSVLDAGFDAAHVVATVSAGFADGCRHELLHTELFAPHLKGKARRIDAVENANFVEPSADQLALLAALGADLKRGAAELARHKQAARAKLEKRTGVKLGDRTLIVSMGRATSQKMHCTVVEAASQILDKNPNFPAFWVFATTNLERDDRVRQEVIAAFCRRHPRNAVSYTERIDFFDTLMAAADLNIMASLWEPFGGALEGTIVPVARCVDGLASQLGLEGSAANLAGCLPPVASGGIGWLFREPQLPSVMDDLKSLLSSAWPSTHNRTYSEMARACAEATRQAVQLHREDPPAFAKLVLNVLTLQSQRSWSNYDRMIELATASA